MGFIPGKRRGWVSVEVGEDLFHDGGEGHHAETAAVAFVFASTNGNPAGFFGAAPVDVRPFHTVNLRHSTNAAETHKGEENPPF
ncbi:MAG: hypothetical protein Q4D62_14095 [Planctomycetia bacterium]|nr:hypothetical protein [Planctomycetia bacterium]